MTHIELGKEGEDIASQFLKKQGYEILAKNYRFKKLEIDLIAKFQHELVIIEVKTRINRFFGEPYLFVTKKKQKQIIKAANQYIHENNWLGETRFDIVSIVLNSNEKCIEHIPQAFYPFL